MKCAATVFLCALSIKFLSAFLCALRIDFSAREAYNSAIAGKEKIRQVSDGQEEEKRYGGKK